MQILIMCTLAQFTSIRHVLTFDLVQALSLDFAIGWETIRCLT